MTTKIKLGGKKVDRKVGRTSDRVGDLIDNGLTERVYKGIIKKPHLRI